MGNKQYPVLGTYKSAPNGIFFWFCAAWSHLVPTWRRTAIPISTWLVTWQWNIHAPEIQYFSKKYKNLKGIRIRNKPRCLSEPTGIIGEESDCHPASVRNTGRIFGHSFGQFLWQKSSFIELSYVVKSSAVVEQSLAHNMERIAVQVDGVVLLPFPTCLQTRPTKLIAIVITIN